MRLIDKNKTIAEIKDYQARVNADNNFSSIIYHAIEDVVRIINNQPEVDNEDDMK